MQLGELPSCHTQHVPKLSQRSFLGIEEIHHLHRNQQQLPQTAINKVIMNEMSEAYRYITAVEMSLPKVD